MGTSTTAPTNTPQNPYALPPQLQAYQQALQSLSGAVQGAGPGGGQGGAAFMRPNPGSIWNPGNQNSLLATILQMRAAQAAGMTAPYQQGVAMPRVSLLTG